MAAGMARMKTAAPRGDIWDRHVTYVSMWGRVCVRARM